MKAIRIATLVLPFLATPGLATPINGASTFDPAFPINLTFDAPGEAMPPDHTPLTNQFQPQGVAFSGIFYNPVGPNPGTPNNSGNGIGDFAANVLAINPHFIEFVNPTTGAPSTVNFADFSLASQPATATITALLGGSPVEQFTASTNLTSTNNIFGFQGILFDTISIAITPDPNAQVQDHADLIDNIQFDVVPEPSTSFLLAVAGIGLCCSGARRRRRAG